MKNKIVFIAFLILFSLQFATAQNLVLNGNFEEVNVCAEYSENCSPIAWRTTNQKLFSFVKQENNNYIELLLFRDGKENQRKFAQTELLCPLQNGEEYKISMKVRANIFGIQHICVAFSDIFEYDNKANLPQTYSNKECIDISQSIKQNEWVEINFKYKAVGSEKFVCIGNLKEDSETEYVVLDKKAHKKLKKSYQAQGLIKYGIDDINIQNINGYQCEDIEDRKMSIIANKHRHSPDWKSYVKTNKKPLPFPPKKDILIRKKIRKEVILNDLKFEDNKYKLNLLNIKGLEPIIQAMLDNTSLLIRIIGHTDLLGSPEYNQDLSLKRADAVRNYLIKKGIDKGRMTIEGKGELEPLKSETDAESNAINRRVVIQIIE